MWRGHLLDFCLGLGWRWELGFGRSEGEEQDTKVHGKGAAKGLWGLLLEFHSEQLAQCCKVPGLNPSLTLGYGEVAETEKAKSLLKSAVEQEMPKTTK